MYKRIVRPLGIALLLLVLAGVALASVASAQEPGEFTAGLAQYDVSPYQEVQLTGCGAHKRGEVYIGVYPLGNTAASAIYHTEADVEEGCFRGSIVSPGEAGKYTVWVRQYAGGGEVDQDRSLELFLTVVAPPAEETGEAAVAPTAMPTQTPRPVVAPENITMTLPATATTGSLVTVTLEISPASTSPLEMSFQFGRMDPVIWVGSSVSQTLSFSPTYPARIPLTATVSNEAGSATVTGTIEITGTTVPEGPVIYLANTGGDAPAPKNGPFLLIAALLVSVILLGFGSFAWNRWFLQPHAERRPSRILECRRRFLGGGH